MAQKGDIWRMESERKPSVEIRVPGNVEKHAICQVCFASLSPFCCWMLFLPLVSYRHLHKLFWCGFLEPSEQDPALRSVREQLQKEILCCRRIWEKCCSDSVSSGTHESSLSGLQLPTGLSYFLGFLVFTINTGCPTSIRVPFHAESNI